MFWLAVLAHLGSNPAWAVMPDAALIAKIERAIQLPPTARRLDGYDRYYAPTIFSGRHMIVGLFLATRIADQNERRAKSDPDYWKSAPDRKGRIQILSSEDRFPEGISDGGCLQILIYWDTATEKVAGVSCNGLA
jgi:hypothetical protein